MAQLSALGMLATRYFGNERFEWQTVDIFLTIADHLSEIPQQELEREHGLSQAAISRNTAKLGNGLTMNDPGARLIESYEDPAYRRRKLVRLTARGKEFRDCIIKMLADGVASTTRTSAK